MALIAIVGALGLLLAGFAAGRYAGWYGLLVPPAITVALGIGWEWDPDAIPLVIAAAVLSGLGYVVGLSRRRKRHAASG
jgi:hypothetical protein